VEATGIPDWETFEQEIKELRAKYRSESSPLLFRGQGNSEWPLTTTLERARAGRMLLREYYELICAGMGPEVKTFAGVDVPTYDPELCKPFLDPALLYEIGDIFPAPVYRYMAYLRHFGFPSPLLDWSRSPFVAAFFAFRDDRAGDKPRRGQFSFTARSRSDKREGKSASHTSARSALTFRPTRGISVSAAIIRFAAGLIRTTGGVLTRTKPSLIESFRGRTICGNLIFLQVSGRRF